MRLLLEDWLKKHKRHRREIVGVGSKWEVLDQLKNLRGQNAALRREIKRLKKK